MVYRSNIIKENPVQDFADIHEIQPEQKVVTVACFLKQTQVCKPMSALRSRISKLISLQPTFSTIPLILPSFAQSVLFSQADDVRDISKAGKLLKDYKHLGRFMIFLSLPPSPPHSISLMFSLLCTFSLLAAKQNKMK